MLNLIQTVFILFTGLHSRKKLNKVYMHSGRIQIFIPFVGGTIPAEFQILTAVVSCVIMMQKRSPFKPCFAHSVSLLLHMTEFPLDCNFLMQTFLGALT